MEPTRADGELPLIEPDSVVSLREVTADNLGAIRALEVFDRQRDFVGLQLKIYRASALPSGRLVSELSTPMMFQLAS